MHSEALPSARSLRARYRDQERGLAGLRLLCAAGQRLGARGSRDEQLADILAEAAAFLAMDSGAVLRSDGGALHVVAARGRALPAGAQLVATGAYALALRNGQPVVRQAVASSLIVARNRDVAVEVLVPLRMAGRGVGLLGLATTAAGAAVDDGDLQVLAALGGLLGAAIAGSGTDTPVAAAADDLQRVQALLTPRELQVFALLPRGLTNAAMSKELGIAPGTVKIHVERILGKLRLRDRTQLAVKATRLGFGS